MTTPVYVPGQANVELDARLVFLCMNGFHLQAGTRYDMTPADLQRRADWLRTQPEPYIEQVVARVEEMEQPREKTHAN